MAIEFSRYDQRRCNTVGVVTGYAEWADRYDEMLTGHLERPVLNALKGVKWDLVKEVADLACGTGRTGEWLLERNRALLIDGVDISREMLSHARRKGIYRTVTHRDLLHSGLKSRKYDLVINVLAACHIPALNRLYAEAMRLSRPGRWFLLVDYHPFFLLNGIPTKFPTKDGRQLAIENYIHLISDHIRVATGIGFDLIDMTESLVTEEWAEQVPSFAKFIGQPIGFGFTWKTE